MEDSTTTDGHTGLDGTEVDSDRLEGLAETLGENWTEDSDYINDGYPILTWQASSEDDGDDSDDGEEVTVLAGDFDGDGAVELDDVMGTLGAYKNGSELTDAQKAAVDTNNDGTVSLSEVMAVLSAYKG